LILLLQDTSNPQFHPVQNQHRFYHLPVFHFLLPICILPNLFMKAHGRILSHHFSADSHVLTKLNIIKKKVKSLQLAETQL